MKYLIELNDNHSENVQYDYPDYPIYVRRGLLSAYPNYTAPSHWHDDIEFIVILSGTMHYNINGEVIVLHDGEGLFINAKQMHFGFSEEHLECDFLCVLLHPLLLCSSKVMERDYVLPVIQNQDIPFLKLSQNLRWNQKIISQLQNVYDIRNSTAAPMKIQGIFADVWSVIYENIPYQSKTLKNSNRDLITLKNMLGFIQLNYSEKITLARIAKAGAVGQSRCCKLFKEYLGQTPNAYIVAYRLNKSTDLLQYSDMTIAEIAFTVGFSGASYYTEIFHKWIGCTPSEYACLKNKNNTSKST